MRGRYTTPLIGISLMFMGPIVLAASSGTLKGIVSDTEGAALSAHIVIHEDIVGRGNAPHQQDVIPVVDKDGRFTVELTPGFYDVCAMADAFTPSCRKVLIKVGLATEYWIQLRADPKVSEMIGDRF